MKIMYIKCLLLCLLFVPINVFAFDIYSSNGILYNLNDDEVLFSKNASDKVMIASLTKIMSAVVVIENVDNLDDYVVVDFDAFTGLDGYALAGFRIGDKVTYLDLLYGLLLPSGAECAQALAINVAGSVSDFVKLMNLKALDLGLNDTSFSNPIGMDDVYNYSTVSDVAMLLRYALENEVFYDIFTSREYVTSNNIVLESTLNEKSSYHNLDVSNILGSKTGFTDGALYCLASISSINGVDYLLVTTGANTNNEYQVIDAINVYNYYSSNYGYKKVLGYNQLLYSVDFGRRKYDIYSDVDKYLYLSNDVDIDNLLYDYVGVNDLKGVKRGEKIGFINVIYDGNIIYTYDVLFDGDVFSVDFKFIICVCVMFLVVVILKMVKKTVN